MKRSTMKISSSEVNHVAELARLKLDTDELARLQKDLNAILEYMDMLGEVDTSLVEETVYTTEAEIVLREDTVRPSQGISDALFNAPLTSQGQIVVPKVIE